MRAIRHGVLSILCLSASACMAPPYATGSIDEIFAPDHRPVIRRYQAGERTLAYAELPQGGDTPLLFLHGSPGEWQAWTPFLGEDDGLVDPRTADWIEARLSGTPHRILRVPDAGHFILWQQPELVVQAISDLAETL